MKPLASSAVHPFCISPYSPNLFFTRSSLLSTPTVEKQSGWVELAELVYNPKNTEAENDSVGLKDVFALRGNIVGSLIHSWILLLQFFIFKYEHMEIIRWHDG